MELQVNIPCFIADFDDTGEYLRSKGVNIICFISGFDDTGEYWRSWYEMEGFEAEVLRLWTDVEPLYKELHAYVRRKLEEKYKDNAFPKDGRIPAHLLGEASEHRTLTRC